ncbi:MAG: nuclear transport factor 2 family protein [Bacteroidetes bacterium]|nr:MAG: nuclear transport factor 2 family protein [Bacteroidota bacterium]REK00975.1 MAG: nuclear transport factor 2 family protein [Bacteroidota bacterium]REK34578.1 MAG: nuclear transport factor 2 family protein [Bacteroidota bacterium]REK51837.1 MAG: nuclear transport factor 2 family protein [Bacteroidota bacterium]
MKTQHKIQTLIVSFTFLIFAYFSCTSPKTETPAPINKDFVVASSEYSDLAANAIEAIGSFDFEKWGTMLSEDVEFHFPDGNENTRTKLIGKKAVLDWWTNWKSSSGVKSLTFTLPNHIPVESIIAPNMTGLPGVYVFSYFSMKMELDNGNIADVRMNFTAHFNKDKQIDRYYTYYDRTPIIQAMGRNILSPEK